jgi:hypothetical protein
MLFVSNPNFESIKGQHKRDGIYADIERACKVFYQCINQNKIREAKCPNNLKFNSFIGRCDNPQKIVAPCGTYALSSASSTGKSCSFKKNKINFWSFLYYMQFFFSRSVVFAKNMLASNLVCIDALEIENSNIRTLFGCRR